jgi:hypothetical protein
MLFSERSEFGMIKLAGGRPDVTQAAIVPMLESITPTLLETRPTSDRRKHRLIDISRKWPCLSVVCGFSVEEGILRERRWWRSLSARRDPDSRYDAHRTATILVDVRRTWPSLSLPISVSLSSQGGLRSLSFALRSFLHRERQDRTNGKRSASTKTSPRNRHHVKA